MPVVPEKRNRPLPNPVPKFLRKVDTNEIFDWTVHLWNRGDMAPHYEEGLVNAPIIQKAEPPVEEKKEEKAKVSPEEGPSFESRVQEVKDAMVKIPTQNWKSFGPTYADLEKILKRKVPKAEYSVALRELKKEAPNETQDINPPNT